MAKQPTFNKSTRYSDAKIECGIINIKSALKNRDSINMKATLAGSFNCVEDYANRLKQAALDAGLTVDSWSCDLANPFDIDNTRICTAASPTEDYCTVKMTISK